MGRLAIGFAAAGADGLLRAGQSAAGMTQGFLTGLGFHVAADRAGVGGITSLRTGGRCDHSRVVMTQSGNDFRLKVVTAGTVTALAACFFAGGFLGGLPLAHIVAQSFTVGLAIGVTAVAGVGSGLRHSTVCGSYHGSIRVAGGRNAADLCAAATGTFAALDAILFAGGFLGSLPLLHIVAQGSLGNFITHIADHCVDTTGLHGVRRNQFLALVAHGEPSLVIESVDTAVLGVCHRDGVTGLQGQGQRHIRLFAGSGGLYRASHGDRQFITVCLTGNTVGKVQRTVGSHFELDGGRRAVNILVTGIVSAVRQGEGITGGVVYREGRGQLLQDTVAQSFLDHGLAVAANHCVGAVGLTGLRGNIANTGCHDPVIGQGDPAPVLTGTCRIVLSVANGDIITGSQVQGQGLTRHITGNRPLRRAILQNVQLIVIFLTGNAVIQSQGAGILRRELQFGRRAVARVGGIIGTIRQSKRSGRCICNGDRIRFHINSSQDPVTCRRDRDLLTNGTVAGVDAVRLQRIRRHTGTIGSDDIMAKSGNHFLGHQNFIAHGTILTFRLTGGSTGGCHSRHRSFHMARANGYPGDGAVVMALLAGGPGGVVQRIVGRCRDTVEHIVAHSRRCVAQEGDGSQRRTVGERSGFNGGDAGADGNRLQSGTAAECTTGDFRDLVADDHRLDLRKNIIPGPVAGRVSGHIAGTHKHKGLRTVQRPPCLCAAAASVGGASPGQSTAVVLENGGGPSACRAEIPHFSGNAGESIGTEAGCVALKHHHFQSGTASKRIAVHIGNGGGDGDGAHTGTAVERIVADRRNRSRDRHCGQGRAAIERIGTDGSHTPEGHLLDAGPVSIPGCLGGRRIGRHRAGTEDVQITGGVQDPLNVAAAVATLRDHAPGQGAAVALESGRRPVRPGRQIIGIRGNAGKGIGADGGGITQEFQALQIGAVCKCIVANGRDTGRNDKLLQTGTLSECGCFHRSNLASQFYRFQTLTIPESATADGQQAVRESNRRKSRIVESTIANGLQLAAPFHGTEAGAVPEGTVTDADNTVRQGDAGQLCGCRTAAAGRQQISTYMGNAVFHHHCPDIGNVVEPGSLIVRGIVVRHGAAAADGQRCIAAAVGQLPLDAGAAGTGAGNPGQGAAVAGHFGRCPCGIRGRNSYRCFNIIECVRGNIGRITFKGDLAEVLAVAKCVTAHIINIGRDGDGCQILALVKRKIRDLIGIGINGRFASLSRGAGMQHASVVENAVLNRERTVAVSHIDGSQIAAAHKRTVAQFLYILGNGKLGQAGTVAKGTAIAVTGICGCTDLGDAVRNGNGLQVGAAIESIVSDGGDAFFDHHRQDLFPQIIPVVVLIGTMQIVHLTGAGKGVGSVIIQNPLQTGTGSADVTAANVPAQRTAIVLVDFGGPGAVVRRSMALDGNTGEGHGGDLRAGAREGHIYQRGAVGEDIVSQTGDGGRKRQVLDGGSRKGIGADGLQSVVKIDIVQRRAVLECAAAQCRDSGRNSGCFKAHALGERIVSDALELLAEGHACQRSAGAKGVFFNAGNRIAEGYRSQGCHTVEGISADNGYGAADGHRSHIGQTLERIVTDGGNTFFDHHRPDVGPVIIPGGSRGRGILGHGAGTLDLQHTVHGHDPRNAFAAHTQIHIGNAGASAVGAGSVHKVVISLCHQGIVMGNGGGGIKFCIFVIIGSAGIQLRQSDRFTVVHIVGTGGLADHHHLVHPVACGQGDGIGIHADVLSEIIPQSIGNFTGRQLTCAYRGGAADSAATGTGTVIAVIRKVGGVRRPDNGAAISIRIIAQRTCIQAGNGHIAAGLRGRNTAGKEGADIAVVCAAIKGSAAGRTGNAAQPGRTVVLRIGVSGHISVVHTACQLRRGKAAGDTAALISIVSRADIGMVDTVPDLQAVGSAHTVTDNTTCGVVTVVTTGSCTVGDGNTSRLGIGIRYNTGSVTVVIIIVSLSKAAAHITIRNCNGAASCIRISNQAGNIFRTGNIHIRQLDILDHSTAAHIGKHTDIITGDSHTGNGLAVAVKNAAECRCGCTNGDPVHSQSNIPGNPEILSAIGSAVCHILRQHLQIAFAGNQIGRAFRTAARPGCRRQKLNALLRGLELLQSFCGCFLHRLCGIFGNTLRKTGLLLDSFLRECFFHKGCFLCHFGRDILRGNLLRICDEIRGHQAQNHCNA